MLVQKMFKGYKVHKYDPFNFGNEELATITLVVPRSELTNDDEIQATPEVHLEEEHEQVLVEETNEVLESSSDDTQKLVAVLGDEEIELGTYKTPESETLIHEHGFSISGIESVLGGKQKTHKKYEFKLV